MHEVYLSSNRMRRSPCAMRISAIVALQTINSLEVPFRRRNTRYPFPLTKYYCTVYRLDRDQLGPKSHVIILAFEKKKYIHRSSFVSFFSKFPLSILHARATTGLEKFVFDKRWNSSLPRSSISVVGYSRFSLRESLPTKWKRRVTRHAAAPVPRVSLP